MWTHPISIFLVFFLLVFFFYQSASPLFSPYALCGTLLLYCTPRSIAYQNNRKLVVPLCRYTLGIVLIAINLDILYPIYTYTRYVIPVHKWKRGEQKNRNTSPVSEPQKIRPKRPSRRLDGCKLHLVGISVSENMDFEKKLPGRQEIEWKYTSLVFFFSSC